MRSISQLRTEIDANLKELDAQLRAELEAEPEEAHPPGPPPALYELENTVGISTIRREE